MKAVLCKSYGPPENLVFEDIDDPEPKDGQVLIDTYATGLNFPDTLQIQGKYQFQPPFPFSPASEVAGMVSAVGNGVSKVAVGDRVSWMECREPNLQFLILQSKARLFPQNVSESNP